MKNTQAWGWLAAGVLALGLNGMYQDGGAAWAQRVVNQVTGEIIDLQFDPAAHESTLTHALAMQKAVAEATPLPKPGELPAETRVLRSEVIHLNMRAGGKDIDTVETDGAGTVDFLPNRPGQPKRFMQGDRIWITYGNAD